MNRFCHFHRSTDCADLPHPVTIMDDEYNALLGLAALCRHLTAFPKREWGRLGTSRKVIREVLDRLAAINSQPGSFGGRRHHTAQRQGANL